MPLRASMALTADSCSSKLTKPKPRLFPSLPFSFASSPSCTCTLQLQHTQARRDPNTQTRATKMKHVKKTKQTYQGRSNHIGVQHLQLQQAPGTTPRHKTRDSRHQTYTWKSPAHSDYKYHTHTPGRFDNSSRPVAASTDQSRTENKTIRLGQRNHATFCKQQRKARQNTP